MSKYLGVITWNVKGDLSTSGTAGRRVQDLTTVLASLANNGNHPVDFICLQETSSSSQGALMGMLQNAGYACYALREGNGQGDYYVFAVSPNSGFTFDGPPAQCLFTYESSSGSPLRYPAVAELSRASDGLKVALYTYHASLDGGLVEGLEKCSEFAVGAAGSGKFSYVLVAGDLNITTTYQVFDPNLGKNVYFLKRLFPKFAGVSENLDHVLCWPDLKSGISVNHFITSSDHELLYGQFKIG